MKATIYLILLMILVQACSMSKDEETTTTTGEGGSLARFTIVNDHLYIVGESTLSTYALSGNNLAPELVNQAQLGFGAETIFPYGNSLLLGTQDGMYIYDITTPSTPVQVKLFQHIRSCDPVVAENGYAYITLNASNQRCWRGLNEMQIVDIHNLNDPFLKQTYTMGSPKGLDIHNDTLFVCDNGLKILDVSDKSYIHELSYLPDVVANDVIYTQGRLLLIGDYGFNQYAISSSGITKLSSIPIQP